MRQILKSFKKNANKIISVFLVLILVGFLISQFGNYLSYIDQQGIVHDNLFMLGGALLLLVGFIGAGVALILKIILGKLK
jgi:hypothetical protein